jgi:hypothetical protein
MVWLESLASSLRHRFDFQPRRKELEAFLETRRDLPADCWSLGERRWPPELETKEECDIADEFGRIEHFKTWQI